MRVTLEILRQRKAGSGRFAVLTCYDAPTARIMEDSGVEVLLVGDTAGEVVLGLPSTREIPPEFLLVLTAAVRRGAPNSYVLAVLPWQCRGGNDPRTVVEWSRRFVGETGADSVKIEVTADQTYLVEAMARAGIAPVAHLGLLPQMIDPKTGYAAQGRDAESARDLIEAARRFESAGAAMLLLEAVASEVAGEITRGSTVPVIGCVAGPHCDGTVVVLHDMIGWGGGHPPRAVRRYADLADVMGRAFRSYADDVRQARFPAEAESIRMRPGEFQRLMHLTGDA